MKTTSQAYPEGAFNEKSAYAVYKSIAVPSLRKPAIKCLFSICLNFFLRQYHSAFFRRIPVTSVDHPILDEKIPFVTSWVTIYLDFVNFWIRMLSFFLRRYGRKAYKPVGEFMMSMHDLYYHVAQIYKKNLSTTKRPFYIAHPRFLLIHILDPHLMCIPSLHIIVSIFTYTKFKDIAKQLGEEENLKYQIEEMKQGALAISQSVLYIKQHSVNCVPATLYTMTCFRPDLFPPEEAENFVKLLFSPAPSADKAPKGCRVHPGASPSTMLPEETQSQIKEHILTLYRKFLSEKENAKKWDEPVLNFLKSFG